MTRSHFLKIGLVLFVATVAWLIWPFYSFYAHMGKAPFLPIGWESMPDESPPVMQEVLDPTYTDAGHRTMGFMQARREQIGAPAFSAAVLISGNIVWRGTVGWADIQSKKPVSLNTQFRIGSTSKALTGTALARMVDRGEIDLDTPISKIMSELPNSQWKDITPRQLASHMAGMPHYKQNGDLLGLYKTVTLDDYFADVREAVSLFDGSPLLFEPGTDFEYSSLGTVLLGAVMSEAAGKPYRQIIQDEVLTPAQVTSTVVAPRRTAEHAESATFYVIQGDRYRAWRPVDLSHRLPGGGFASTPSDLVKIGALQLADGYLSKETRAVFWAPQSLNSGETNEQDYALGWRWREWEIEGLGIARNANHGGVSRGAQSWLLVFPDFDMVVAFNINSKTDEFADFGMFYQDIVREFAFVQAQQNRQ